jgi:hypothetical protein
MSKLSVLLIAALASGCAKSAPSGKPAPSAAPPAAASAAASPPDSPHYGDVMSEIGHRFELMGRAAKAKRFRLAHYEIGELGEALHDDLPRAQPPRKGDPKKLAALLADLDKQRLPALDKAVQDRDGTAVAKAFAETAGICNACHAATGHDFVQIPKTPGETVPLLDPRPAGSAAAGSKP